LGLGVGPGRGWSGGEGPGCPALAVTRAPQWSWHPGRRGAGLGCGVVHYLRHDRLGRTFESVWAGWLACESGRCGAVQCSAVQCSAVSGISRDTSSAVELAPWPARVPRWGMVSCISYDTIVSEEPSSRCVPGGWHERAGHVIPSCAWCPALPVTQAQWWSC
jgi:hypothetical protein